MKGFVQETAEVRNLVRDEPEKEAKATTKAKAKHILKLSQGDVRNRRQLAEKVTLSYR